MKDIYAITDRAQWNYKLYSDARASCSARALYILCTAQPMLQVIRGHWYEISHHRTLLRNLGKVTFHELVVAIAL